MPSEEEIIQYFKDLHSGRRDDPLLQRIELLEKRVRELEDSARGKDVGDDPLEQNLGEPRDDSEIPRYPNDQAVGQAGEKRDQDEGLLDNKDDEKKRDGGNEGDIGGRKREEIEASVKKQAEDAKRDRSKLDVLSEESADISKRLEDLSKSVDAVLKLVQRRNVAHGDDNAASIAQLRREVSEAIGNVINKLGELSRDILAREKLVFDAINKAQRSADWVHAYVTSRYNLADVANKADKCILALNSQEGMLRSMWERVRIVEAKIDDAHRRINKLAYDLVMLKQDVGVFE